MLVYMIKYHHISYNVKLSCSVSINCTSGGTVIQIEFPNLMPKSQIVLKMENIRHLHINSKITNKLMNNKTGYIEKD
jgi:hypothetical protein